MQHSLASISIERSTFLVWVGLMGTGIAAWLTSGHAVIGAIVVMAAILAIGSPSGAVYAACAAIPLTFQPIELGSLSLSLLELGVLIALFGSLARFALDLVERRAIPSIHSRDIQASWTLPVLLLVFGTLSLVWMPFDTHRAEALRTWRWAILEPLILSVLARRAIAQNGRAPLTIAIVLPASLISAYAVWQLGWSTSDFSVDDVQRSTATYLHPNNLALYLERAAMLAIVPAALETTRLRWPFLVSSAVLLAGVATTFSRGALLGVALGAAVVLLAHPIRNGWKYLLTGLAGSAALFAAFAGNRLSGAGSSGFFETRWYLWAGAAEMLRDFPVSGIGLDQFLWLHRQRYIDPQIWSERYTSHPHNLVLDSWLSLGFPGLVLLVAFLGTGAWMIWRARANRVSLDVWQLGALGCLGAGLGHGLVDNGYFLADLSALTWLAIALLIPSARRDSRESHA
jgi:putative inorganic carbon (HCO3(-)) transporter